MTTKLFNIFAYEHGKFIAPRPTFARYFLSETGCKLGNLHRVHKGRESYLRVHICSILTERVKELNFFFGIVLSLARWMERRVFFRQSCVIGIFILLACFKFSENF